MSQPHCYLKIRCTALDSSGLDTGLIGKNDIKEKAKQVENIR